MEIAVEMSLYPLRDQYLPIIETLVRRLNERTDVKVHTTSMSTQVVGDYDLVMQIVQQELKQVFEASQGKNILVCKFLGPLD